MINMEFELGKLSDRYFEKKKILSRGIEGFILSNSVNSDENIKELYKIYEQIPQEYFQVSKDFSVVRQIVEGFSKQNIFLESKITKLIKEKRRLLKSLRKN